MTAAVDALEHTLETSVKPSMEAWCHPAAYQAFIAPLEIGAVRGDIVELVNHTFRGDPNATGFLGLVTQRYRDEIEAAFANAGYAVKVTFTDR